MFGGQSVSSWFSHTEEASRRVDAFHVKPAGVVYILHLPFALSCEGVGIFDNME